MFLHGLCAVLIFSRAPEGVASPATETGGPEGIEVTLVTSPAPPTLAPARAAPATRRSPAVDLEPISNLAALATTGAAGEGRREALAGGGAPARGVQAAAAAAAAVAGSDYRARLLAHIQTFRRYPVQALDARGVTQILFMVDQDGRIVGVWVKASSGFEALDNEAVATVLRAQPMPQAPAGLPSPLAVQLPVSFSPS